MLKFQNPIVWIDLEMTGLNPTKNQVIEIAVIVTEADLSNAVEGPDLIIHASQEEMGAMDEWCTKTHGESGLTEQVLKSSLSLEEAEGQVLRFLKDECGIEPKTAPIGGNSIAVDKMFIYKDFPRLYEFLHYRMIDVSTLKILCDSWTPEIARKRPAKAGGHRAMDDIRESIEELKFYREHFIKI